MKTTKFMVLMAAIAGGFLNFFQGGGIKTSGRTHKAGSSLGHFKGPQYRQMMINRKKRRRKRNKIAKESRKINRHA